MSKERRRKQFERLLTRVCSEGGQSEEANGDRMLSDELMERVVKRIAAGNSSIDITVLDDPANMDGFLALQRVLGKHGVSIEEVPDSDVASIGRWSGRQTRLHVCESGKDDKICRPFRFTRGRFRWAGTHGRAQFRRMSQTLL